MPQASAELWDPLVPLLIGAAALVLPWVLIRLIGRWVPGDSGDER
jgi:hypothetical protein